MLILLPDSAILVLDPKPRTELRPEDVLTVLSTVRKDLEALFPAYEISARASQLWCYSVTAQRIRVSRMVAALALSVDYGSLVDRAEGDWRKGIYAEIMRDMGMKPKAAARRVVVDSRSG